VGFINLKKMIRDIPDFPVEGIIFKDITTLLMDAEALQQAIRELAAHYRDLDFDYIAGIESRGFIIGAPVAFELKKGFIPIRKPGKLPAETISISYQLEYGTGQLDMHKDALQPGNRVVLIDDLLATGGTIEAAIGLIKKMGGEVVGIGFLLELLFLKGRERLQDYDLFALLQD